MSIIPVAIQTFLAASTDPSCDEFTHNDLKLLIVTTLRDQQLFKPKSIIFTQLRERLEGTPWFDRLTQKTQQVSFSGQCTFLIYECSFINLYVQSLFFFFPPLLHNYNLQNVNIYEFTGCSLEREECYTCRFFLYLQDSHNIICHHDVLKNAKKYNILHLTFLKNTIWCYFLRVGDQLCNCLQLEIDITTFIDNFILHNNLTFKQ